MTPRHSNALAVLKQRNFRYYFVGQATSLLGDGMVSVALSFAVLDLTGSPSDLGFVLTARSFSMVTIVLIGGVFADRFPRRGVMVAADIARFLSHGTTATLLISGHTSVWQLALLQAVDGGSAALFTPASIGLMPTIAPSEHLQRANALRGMAFSFGTSVGPALSGVLISVASPGAAIMVNAATFGISAIALVRLRLSDAKPSPAQSFFRDLLSGWIEFRSRRWVWGIVVLSALANMLFASFIVLGPAIAKASLGGAPMWAAIMTAFGIGSVLGGLAAFRLQPRRPLRAIVLTIALQPLPILGLAAGLPALIVAGLAFLSGMSATIFNVIWETFLQRRIPSAALSRVSAYDWFAAFACQPLGQSAAGPLAAAIGIYPALWVAGTVQLTVTFGTLAVPDIRCIRAEDPGKDARTGKDMAAESTAPSPHASEQT